MADIKQISVNGTPYDLNVPNGKLTTAQLSSSLQSTINSKADDSTVVHKTGNEEITGNKVFTSDNGRTVISGAGVQVSFPEPEDNPPVRVNLGYYGFEMQIDEEGAEEPDPEHTITVGKDGIEYQKYNGTEWETTLGIGSDGSITTESGTIDDIVSATNNAVHKTGNETIDGTKTFNGTVKVGTFDNIENSNGSTIAGALTELGDIIGEKQEILFTTGHPTGVRTLYTTSAGGRYAFAEGYGTKAEGSAAHAEGWSCEASGSQAHAEGNFTKAANTGAHSEGINTIASGNGAHAEGVAREGDYGDPSSIIAAVDGAHAEGYAGGQYAGGYIEATALGAHAEGCAYEGTISASGDGSHAEGFNTTASSSGSHAEGYGTIAKGSYSHAEGHFTTASTSASHAEGNYTTALGNYSHAEGQNTISNNLCEHSEGSCNKSNKANNTWGDRRNTLHSIGIGANTSNRKNAFEVMQNGDIYVLGIGNYDGTNAGASGVLTLQQVLSSLS